MNIQYLNTSYVKVKQTLLLQSLTIKLNLNTSYVKVKHKSPVTFTEYPEFKYILC